MLGKFSGSWDEFFTLFQQNGLIQGNVMKYSSEWTSCAVENPNKILLLKYEDMKSNLQNEMQKIVRFLDLNVDENVVRKIAAILTFENERISLDLQVSNMRQLQSDILPFFRRGIVGDWQNYFNHTQSQYMDIKAKLYETRAQ